MKVNEINEGTKISYEVKGTALCLDNDLTINLSARQKDYPVHIDVCTDEKGALVIGAKSGRYYVAQIDIPAKEYSPSEKDEEAPTAKPLNMNEVTITLWALVNRAPTI